MIIYDSTKSGFMDDVENGNIADRIYDRYMVSFGRPSPSEYRSWENSMDYMYTVLNYNDLPDDTGVAIEFNIPLSSKRIDFILSGTNFSEKIVISIELKQWQKIEKIEGKDGIVKTVLGGGLRETIHPSYQALSYKHLIEDFIEAVETENIIIVPCVFLHNYKIVENDPINDIKLYGEYIDEAPIFGKRDIKRLRSFISKYIKYGDKNIIYSIEHGNIRPSKRLQDTLSNMLRGNNEFMMIDDQKLVYETAKQMALRSFHDNKKRVLIVEGGPGTGKSVVAVNLLVELINEGLVSTYVTRNAAPREVFFNLLKGNFKANYIKNLFKSSGSFVDSDLNDMDALIVDEAHRLNEKSGLYGNQGEHQIKEIINSSKFSIFFIDKYQRVTIKDIGDSKTVKYFADYYDAECKKLELKSQFRCNGSDGYLAWINNVLEIEKTANFNGFDFNYEFEVLDSLKNLEKIIFKKNEKNNKSRILAGYCWDWEIDGRNNPNIFDISIPLEEFQMSWNLSNTGTWAVDDGSVNQVGCIHTSQGLEFDYVGVIIGEDMRYEDNEIITDFNKRARTDRSLFGIKKLYKEDKEKALEISDNVIKNTYRTLMTRGMKGCYVYCIDDNLQEYFKEKLD